jgi:hypothetical protein
MTSRFQTLLSNSTRAATAWGAGTAPGVPRGVRAGGGGAVAGDGAGDRGEVGAAGRGGTENGDGVVDLQLDFASAPGSIGRISEGGPRDSTISLIGDDVSSDGVGGQLSGAVPTSRRGSHDDGAGRTRRGSNASRRGSHASAAAAAAAVVYASAISKVGRCTLTVS